MRPAEAKAILRRDGWLGRLPAIGGRYGVATFGTTIVSAVYLLATLALLRELPPLAFGHFAFILVVVGFTFSLTTLLKRAWQSSI
jgi:hypothetical protein